MGVLRHVTGGRLRREDENSLDEKTSRLIASHHMTDEMEAWASRGPDIHAQLRRSRACASISVTPSALQGVLVE